MKQKNVKNGGVKKHKLLKNFFLRVLGNLVEKKYPKSFYSKSFLILKGLSTLQKKKMRDLSIYIRQYIIVYNNITDLIQDWCKRHRDITA